MMIKRRPPPRKSLPNASAVTITRAEIESWLDGIGLPWKRAQGTSGIYLIGLSPNVAIKFSSTLSSSDVTVAKGEGSVQFTLVKAADWRGKPINVKAIEQDYFARTKNWRGTWLEKGVDVMRAEYEAKRAFYESLATPPVQVDPAASRQFLARVEAIPGWQKHSSLSFMHKRTVDGNPVTPKMIEALEREEAYARPRAQAYAPPARAVEPPRPTAKSDDIRVVALRMLYAAARQTNSEGVMKLAKDAAIKITDGGSLEPRLTANLAEAMQAYGVPFDFPSDAEWESVHGVQRAAMRNRAPARGKRGRR